MSLHLYNHKMVRPEKLIRVLLLISLAGVLTMTLQGWVGKATIYAENLESKRLMLHNAILRNTLPEGYTWKEIGAYTVNIRILVAFFAEMIHKITNYEVYKIYILIDTICIFVIIIALFVYLKKWVNNQYCTIGILYFCSIMPLTYFLYAFHPWDRPSLLFWILLLYLLREKKVLTFAVVLAISITIKYDTVLLPGLYFLYMISHKNWRKTLFTTTMLFAISFGVYFLLLRIFPGVPSSGAGYTAKIWSQVSKNVEQMFGYDGGIKYPPLLGFSIPILLAFWGLRVKERFMLACVVFGCMLIIPWFLFSNFIEIRAEMPLLVLLLPSSLMGLKFVFEEKTINMEGYLQKSG